MALLESTDLRGLAARLVELGRESGLDAVGVARAAPFLDTRHHLRARREEGLHGGMHFTYGNPERATEPDRVVRGARALVVGAAAYRRRAGSDGGGGPGRGAVARYAWSDRYAPLREALGAVAEVLRAEGWRAEVRCDSNDLVDRAAAHRAGLGWFGRNSLLLVPGLGSWVLLGSVVTDAALPPTASAPMAPAEGCGPCRRCMTVCPTGAFVAPGVLDARRCLAWALQAPGVFPRALRPALGGRIYGCDDCQEVCPPNLRADRLDPPPAAGTGEVASVDLVALLGLGDGELLARFGHWYIARRDPRYLRRNALVALGNVGDPGDEATGSALAAALADADPLLRAHAVWAAGRLGRGDLLEALDEAETDPEVLDELAEARR